MKQRFVLITVLALACTPAWAADSFNARPGAWENTVTTSTSGMVIPPEALAKMPPERRAMVEKMMGDKNGGGGSTRTQKTCVKKEDLDQGRFLTRTREGCKVDVITRTPTRLVAKTTCTGETQSEGTLEFTAKDPEHVSGSIDQTMARGGKFHVDIVGKWLSASCDGIEPPMKNTRQ